MRFYQSGVVNGIFTMTFHNQEMSKMCMTTILRFRSYTKLVKIDTFGQSYPTFYGTSIQMFCAKKVNRRC